MPRIIFKCPYIKPGTERAAAHLNNYVRYVATRDGTDLLKPDKAGQPATKKQRAMVERLLWDFPMCRGMFEYEDYQAAPTRRNASEFITCAIEDNYESRTGAADLPPLRRGGRLQEAGGRAERHRLSLRPRQTLEQKYGGAGFAGRALHRQGHVPSDHPARVLPTGHGGKARRVRQGEPRGDQRYPRPGPMCPMSKPHAANTPKLLAVFPLYDGSRENQG